MLGDCREYRRILDAEAFAREFRAEARVKQQRVRALEFVDLHPAGCALVEQALRGIEAGKVVEQAGEPRLRRVDTVATGESLRVACDADAVRVTVPLADLRPRSAGNVVIGQRAATASRSARSRLR